MSSSSIHAACFYETDEVLIRRLTQIVLDSFVESRKVMLFLTRSHKEQLEAALGASIDVNQAVAESRLQIFDAQSLLETIVEGESIPKARFDMLFRKLLADTEGTRQEMTICGEIVNLLWQQGRPHLALQLEQLWDNVHRDHRIHLYCAYSSRIGDAQREYVTALAKFHEPAAASAGTSSL